MIAPIDGAEQVFLPTVAGPWVEVKDGNLSGLSLYGRHYSCRKSKAKRQALFVGPGEKMVLLTPCARGLFVWRKFISLDEQDGVNCAVFRNEGAGLASSLIRAAMARAWERWPGERLYTYVNARKIRSTNPGCCFRRAGWRRCGETKGGLLILEALPA